MARISITIDDRTYEVEVDDQPGEGSLLVRVNGESIPVILPDLNGSFETIRWVVVDSHPYEIVFDPQLSWISSGESQHRLEMKVLEPGRVHRPSKKDRQVTAPIPGEIARVLISAGQTVTAGDLIVVLEAMKMENELFAPCSGVTRAVHATPGEAVLRGQVLVEIE